MSVKLWLPGAGVVNLDVRRAMAAVKEYDERLIFGMNQNTGQWTVFLNRGPSEEPLPILAFAPGVVPDRDLLIKELYKRDAMRRGNQILDDINKNNQRIKLNLELKAQEGTAAAAEAFEWGFRRMGAHPTPRIFVPRGI